MSDAHFHQSISILSNGPIEKVKYVLCNETLAIIKSDLESSSLEGCTVYVCYDRHCSYAINL